MKFYFCETCGKRITETDLESGQGKNKKLKGVFCDQCAVGVMTMETMPLTEDDARKILGKPSDSKAPVKRDTGAHRAAKRGPLPPKEAESKSSYVLAGLAAAVVLIFFLFLLVKNREPLTVAQTSLQKKSSPTEEAPGGKTAPPPLPAVATEPRTPPAHEPAPAEPEKPAESEPAPPAANPAVDPAVDAPAAKSAEGETPPEAREPREVPSGPSAGEAKTAEPAPPAVATPPTTPETPAPAEAPKTVEHPPAVSEKDLLVATLADVLKLAGKNQLSEAEAFLIRKSREDALAPIAAKLTQEKSDFAAARGSRAAAMEALRRKVGTVFTVNLGASKVTGVVRDGPGADRVSLSMKDGPELAIRSDQLGADDVETLLPLEDGKSSPSAWKQRAIFLFSAGEAGKAAAYFKKAGEEGAAYLEVLSAQREVSADEDWAKAEQLFEAGSWKPAKAAYETFQARYAGTAALAGRQEALKSRQEAIATALAAGADLVVDLGGVKLVFVQIPAGVFEMGSGSDGDDEKPVHRVKITRPFYMGKFLVTQAQYEMVTGQNPCEIKGDDLPVDRANQGNAVNFCKLASQLTGRNITLPTEAEWEYACRAGTKTKYYTGDTEAALAEAGWYAGNSDKKPQPVGKKKPNAWGLYDMHGSVWQVCMDWYAADYYAKSEAADPPGPDRSTGAIIVLRGGSRTDGPSGCRSATRSNTWQHDASWYRPLGFRVVIRDAGPAPKKR